jgi:hypothetical protein
MISAYYQQEHACTKTSNQYPEEQTKVLQHHSILKSDNFQQYEFLKSPGWEMAMVLTPSRDKCREHSDHDY